jgi:outer membrane lipoprotein SlyB
MKPADPAPPARGQGSEVRGTTSAMGSASACEKCGVVESVLAANKPGEGFQMRIRMDDGSLRTVEQRGALAAGTRVVVEGRSVRLPG